MLARRIACAGICALALLTAAAAQPRQDVTATQQDEPPSDDDVMLPCNGKCPAITEPVNIHYVMPNFASGFSQGYFVEGVVELEYTIGVDGHVGSDVTVLRLLGPREFADSAKRAVRDWIYKPALMNGKPVAISHKLLSMFRVPGIPRGARGSIVNAYDDAAKLIKDGKLDEADAKLREALQQDRLNFYERGMIANLQTAIAIQRRDFVAASHLSAMPMIFPSDSLPPAVWRNLCRYNIVAALNLGDIVGADKALAKLRKVPGFDPADPLVKASADLRTKLDALPSFSARAEIPDPAEADVYGFWLYRRNFTFTNIKGELDRFTLNCRNLESQSPISEKAEWRVPDDWGDCILYIRGKPGTTFDIVQFAADKPNTP